MSQLLQVCIPSWVTQNRQMRVVLGSCPEQSWTSDINLLNPLCQCDARFSDRLLEGIEIDLNQSDGFAGF